MLGERSRPNPPTLRDHRRRRRLNDGSLELAKTFECDRVRVIPQTNRGQGGALNTAMNAAQGDYFQFLDADDVMGTEKVAAQVALLQTAEPTAVASGPWARFRGKIQEARFIPEPIWRDLTPVEWLVASWSGGGMMHVAAWLIPRQVAIAAGPWDESVRWAPNVDALFFTKTLLASTVCLFCPTAVSYYRSIPSAPTKAI